MKNFDRRIKRLSEQLQSNGLDYLCLIPGANFTYYTGIDKDLSERPFVALFPATGSPAFIIPKLEHETTQKLLPYKAGFFTYTDEEGHEAAFQQAAHALGLSKKRIGVEYRSMRMLELRQIERQAPDCLITEADPLLSETRMNKDDEELAKMREAIRISEAALAATIKQVEPGQTELEIQNILHIELLRAGAHGLGFPLIVLSGPRAALPHGTAADRAVKTGDCLLFDYGGKYGPYTADITRTFVVGTAGPDWKDIYHVVKEANAAAREIAGPGVETGEVDRAARQVIERADYGDNFTHRTGHGLGLDVHEPPYIVAGGKTRLQPGMTFTIEPGIYITGEIGVRIEDDVLITENGCDSLTSFPRDLTTI
ncbi:MAG: Xaa-Pro peptidase family protein [Candidatus Bipolaricaulota bacterium]|nr:Xaa-Pro peptidase family protein [Candidatus Bipolaricaulota bacterium]